MLELTALSVIILLYIIPLNILFYYISKETVMSILQFENIAGVSKASEIAMNAAAAFFYILYVGLLFITIYLIYRFIVVKSLYVYLDNELEVRKLILKYQRGQKNIDAVSIIAIVLVLMFHILFRVFDIKIFVLAFLCIAFVFRKRKIKKSKGLKQKESIAEEQDLDSSSTNTLYFEWYYNNDPLGMQHAVRFSVNVPVSFERYADYKTKKHLDNSSMSLREHVLEGICPEIIEVAKQIKSQCASRGFTTFHQASAVMAFQQSLKYVEDIASKNQEEYVRYPLETLVDKEGDCDCHGICSAAILFSMGYDIVLLRIVFPEGGGHLAIAVEGADGIPGNFFELSGRKYYYCEVTPSEGSRMNFKIGEMPDMPGASITAIPVKEIVNNL